MNRLDARARLVGRIVAVLAVIYFGAHLAVAQDDPVASAVVAVLVVTVATIVAVLVVEREPME